MIQQLLLYLLTLAMHIHSIYGSCSVTRVIMRVPHEHDIGLIFDLTVSNRRTANSEMLDFTVTSDGLCTLNTTSGEQVLASKIFGGDFGSIEPGSSITVSLVWPTVSLYNRVGSCPILVSSVNHQNESNKTKQILHFDTRFETLDPGNHSLRRRKDFTDCKNWDKDYFRNCTRLNCEELYFGKRSFYNRTTEQCESVPACIGDGIQYDFYANECVDINNFITDEEIEQLKQGKFDNNYMELHEYEASKMIKHKTQEPKENEMPTTRKTFQEQKLGATKGKLILATKLSLTDFNNRFQHLNDPIKHCEQPTKQKKVSKKSTMTSLMTSFYYDWYLPLKAGSESASEDIDGDDFGIDTNPTTTNNSPRFGSMTFWNRFGDLGPLEWISLIMEMLLILSSVLVFQIIATVFTYVIVCLSLYGLMELIALFKPYEVSGAYIGKKLTPRHKKSEPEIMTSASLMSQMR